MRRVERTFTGGSRPLVNAVLAGINLATTPDRLWVQWPLAGWGIGVVAHAAAFMFARRKSAAPSSP